MVSLDQDNSKKEGRALSGVKETAGALVGGGFESKGPKARSSGPHFEAGAKMRRCAAGALLGTLLSVMPAGWALQPKTPLANLNRQTWVMENGLPQNTVQALAQTADGYLWLGTEVGLVRFDGMSFALFDEHSKPALPSSDAQCLLAAKDGALWIGTSDGLVRMKNGALTRLTTEDGLPANDIQSLTQDETGVITTRTASGTAEVRGDGTISVQVTSENGPGAGDMQLKAGLDRRRGARADKTTVTLTEANGTELKWSVGRELPGTRVQAIYGDREGVLWIGTNGGLIRYADGRLDKLPVTDPMATASVLAILEDREGNLWVGTESNGLHILRDQRFQTLTTREGLPSDNTTTVVQDGAGMLWVGTAGSGVTALKPGSNLPGKTYSVRNGLLSDVILSLAAAPNGDLWVGTADGLSLIRYGIVTSFTSSDGLADDFIRSLHADADGSLWIGTRRGLTHWTKAGDLFTGQMETFTTANGLGSNLVGALARDGANGEGDLWIATFAGLARLHQGKLTNFTTANGLSSNVITAILPRKNGALLVGTQDRGWNSWDGSKFTSVSDQGLGRTTVHAILDDGNGHLWFATGTGLARCDCESGMGPMHGADCTHWLELGSADGLRSRETAVNSHPSAWRAQDGHLWFATPKGLIEIDPAHFPVNAQPPPVAVERFAVDDADQSLSASNLRVPAGHNHFQIDYAGLSFVAPQKVRYRYMLEGFDHSWTDAGTRRTAYYTNIPPGHYTFRVQAANNDSVWNTDGATLRFELRPHFYQTAWFYALLVLGLIGLVFLGLRLRLLRAEREFRAVLGERNRIAREVHDTLVQGYVGISVQLEVLIELIRHGRADAAARHLDAIRGYVRDGLNDARQSIWALRSQDAEETTLPVRMRRLVETTSGHGLNAQLSIYGAYRPLSPTAESEILRVAQEALHNVKKHSGAKNVKVQLEYSRHDVALEVRDDGRGFEVGDKVAASDSGSGHFGLTGMRERAASIGGMLEVISEPGAGTTIRLTAAAPLRRMRPTKELPARTEAAGAQEDTAVEETKEQS